MLDEIERKPHSKHKKRYWKVCADCKQRFRAAHPEALYCGSACAKHAQRQRQAARIEAALIEAEQRRAALLKAEAARKAEAAQRARNAQIEAERRDYQLRQMERAEQEAKAREAARVFPRCECGNDESWRIMVDHPLIGKVKARRICPKCYHAEPLQGVLICPACKTDTQLRVDAFGKVHCTGCGHKLRSQFTRQSPG